MAVLRLLYFCLALIIAEAEAAVIIRFDHAPPYESSSDTAIFRYSVVGLNGSNLCHKNVCSILCEVDGQALTSCPADIIVLKNLTVNCRHHFRLNVMTKDGKRNSSSYTWSIDTIPPTATISSGQKYTSAAKIAVDITFSEACTGKGGFRCFNSSHCDVTVSGPADIDASSLRVIEPNIKYTLDTILSPSSTYGRVVVKLTNNFCTDKAGNSFTRTNASIFTLYLDRRPVQVDLWTTVPSYELEFKGILRTVTSTNRMEELKFFLEFSSPIINSTDEIRNALHPNSGFILPLHSRNHGNRRFAFELKNVSRTEIITVELQDGSVIGRSGTPVSPVAPLTFLYDSTNPSVWLSTSSARVTREPYIHVIIEFTKPVFGFDASKVEAEGGYITRFEELSKALYSLIILAESQNLSVIVPAGKVRDISGNLNSASNQLEVKHNSAPAISVALHSFMSVGIVATSLAATMLSLSTANLEAVGTLASGRTSMDFSGPSTNLQGMVGHLQMFVLSDWISVTLPVEYSATTQGLRWLIPREKLPWKRERSPIWSNHSYPVGEQHGAKFGAISIGVHDGRRKYHSFNFNSINFPTPLHQRLPFPIEIYPKSHWPHELQNVTIRSTSYGLPLSTSEYFTYFLRGEPMSANRVVNRLEDYTGWQDLEMNLFWLGVGGTGLVIMHIFTLIFIRWRTQTKANGILSVPRFELLLLILMLPCVSQSSAFVIRGGTTGGILTGALLLAIPGGLVISVCLFLIIAIFSGSFAQYKEVKCIDTEETLKTKMWLLVTGRPTIGKWFYREGLPLSILPRFGVIFENQKGPPVYIVVDQNDANQISRWTESGQNGIGRMRAISSDDSNEETRAPKTERLFGCARSSYIIVDLVRRATLGVLSGVHLPSGRSPSLFALIITAVQLLYLLIFKPYIRRRDNMVESLSLLCEAGVFGLSISTSGSNLMNQRTTGYLMLGFLCLVFVSQIINQWYAMIKFLVKLSQPRKNSFKFGFKYATKGLLLPLLPRKYWSSILPGSFEPKKGQTTKTEHERRDARPPHVDPLGAMNSTVVPVLSPGSPGLKVFPMGGSTTPEIPLKGNKVDSGKRLKEVHVESKTEMRKLRELARASLSRVSKLEEGSTSYG